MHYLRREDFVKGRSCEQRGSIQIEWAGGTFEPFLWRLMILETIDGSQEVKVLGVVVKEVSEPQSAGRGRMVYDVPLQLSRRVPREWARYFLNAWHNGPNLMAVRKPAVVNVGADRIVLEGTNIEEVEQLLGLIKFALSEANRKSQGDATRHDEEEVIMQQKRNEHLHHVEETARRLRF